MGLQLCSSTAQPNRWTYDSSTQELQLKAAGSMRGAEGGTCMDITSHLTTSGANVETYGCNGGSNQQWSAPPAAAGGSGSPGAITSKQDGHCLTVCPSTSSTR